MTYEMLQRKLVKDNEIFRRLLEDWVKNHPAEAK